MPDPAPFKPEPLSREDRRAWLRALSSWQTPESMAAKLERLSEALGPRVLTDPRAGFFRDGWCAARFARLRSADQVRLAHPDPRPDFEIRTGDVVQAFELVEADLPGRRRGDELRTEPSPAHVPEDEWMDAQAAHALLQHAAGKKADGRYARTCSLLIYLSRAFASDAEVVPAVFREATAPAAGAFAEVWVLSKDDACQAW